MEITYVLGGLLLIAFAMWAAQKAVEYLYGEDLEVKLQEVADAQPTVVLPPVSELKKMTKAKLEEFGRELGVELDKRKTKDNMIKQLRDEISS